MARPPPTYDAVRRIGLTLPDVVESTIYGSPALKLHGNPLACVPINKSAEPNCAALWIGADRRDALIRENPAGCYLTDHYASHPIVLVRLSRIGRNELRALLRMAWRFVAAQLPARGAGTARRAARRGSPLPRRKRTGTRSTVSRAR